jgi:predicted nucleotidyltransferase
MKLAAIIAEYNPFHNGHKYQIDKAREILGDDVAIVAIMSGNYTQRGELAIMDKTMRAEAAVMAGANLVIELPFPYSCSSAEIFATAGVSIAGSIGADYLVFGSECGDISSLAETTDIIMSDSFKEKVEIIKANKNYASLGYPKIAEMAYKELAEDDYTIDIASPNNILAIEYIKAIKSLDIAITPITIKRHGAGYSEIDIIDGERLQSATAIRKLITNNSYSAYEYIPNSTKAIFDKAQSEGLMPSSIEKLATAIISSLRLNTASNVKIFDADDGLYNRLCTLSMKTNSISSLAAMAETKKHTRARIRRAIINSFFGVTSSLVKEPPAFTQVLAMDDVGRSALKRIKKTTDFPCITKPSDYTDFSNAVISQKELSNKADAIYTLSLPGEIEGTYHLTFTPFVKK